MIHWTTIHFFKKLQTVAVRKCASRFLKFKDKKLITFCGSIKSAILRKSRRDKLLTEGGGRGHLHVLKYDKLSARGYCRHMTAPVGRNANSRVHLRHNCLNANPIVNFNHRKISWSTNVIHTVGGGSNTAHRVCRQTIFLGQNICNFFVDNYWDSVIVCSYKKAAIIINIKTADSFNRLILIHKTELFSVVAVKAGVSSYPQNSIRSTCNVICLTTGQTVCIVVNSADKRVELFWCGISAGRKKGAECKNKKQGSQRL